MTTYNRASLVVNAVNSILRQTYGDFELVIVDDGSTDGTFERLRDSVVDDRVQVHRLNNNVGMYAASNYALQRWVTGEYITWQDSDDTSHPDRLRRQVVHLRTHPVDAVSIAHENAITGERYFDRVPAAHAAMPAAFPLRRFSRYRDALSFSVTRGMFRTERVLEIGGFNGRYRISMDSDFVARFQRLFPSGGITDQALYYWHPRADSLTQAIATGMRSPARRRVFRSLVLDRCVSFLLWQMGAYDHFYRSQIQDFYYPAGLEVEQAWTSAKNQALSASH
jgi:glycosyltransferase involved in cell wall biosynthesis